MNRRTLALVGRTAGKLTVREVLGIRLAAVRKNNTAIVRCECACGAEVRRVWNSIVSALCQRKVPACAACTSRRRREQMPRLRERGSGGRRAA